MRVVAAQVYALGMTLFAMWTGRHPFSPTNHTRNGGGDGDGDGGAAKVPAPRKWEPPFRLMMRVSDGERPNVPPGMPPVLRALVTACWAHEPSERPAMTAVVTRLEALRAEMLPPSQSPDAADAARHSGPS